MSGHLEARPSPMPVAGAMAALFRRAPRHADALSLLLVPPAPSRPPPGKPHTAKGTAHPNPFPSRGRHWPTLLRLSTATKMADNGLTIAAPRLKGSQRLPRLHAGHTPDALGNRLTVDPRTLTPLVLVRIQVPQPNLIFYRFGLLAGLDTAGGGCGFRKQIKRLAESGDHVAILPSAVR